MGYPKATASPVMIYKRQTEVDDGTLEDCEPDDTAVIIIAVVISVTVLLAGIGFYLWRRAQAKRQQRKLAWRDFVPQWLNFGNEQGHGPEMLQYPGSYGAHSSYDGYNYPSNPTPVASAFSQNRFAKSPMMSGSGYHEGSAFSNGSGGSRRYKDVDEYSIDSYEEESPRRTRSGRTPTSAKSRAMEDAWQRARSGSGSGRGRSDSGGSGSGYRSQSRREAYEDESPRVHRSRSHRR